MRSPHTLLFIFIGEVLQPLDHLHGPALDPVQELHVLLLLGAPVLDAVFHLGPHEGRVEGDNPPQVEDSALALVKPHLVPPCTTLQSVQVLLNGSTALHYLSSDHQGMQLPALGVPTSETWMGSLLTQTGHGSS